MPPSAPRSATWSISRPTASWPPPSRCWKRPKRASPSSMPETFDLIVRGGEVVNHAGRGLAAIGDLGQASAGETFDAAGLTVLPGVIDTQVHFREPGMDWKEDLESGSRAAVLGGVTAVFEMPNTDPPTSNRAALEEKLARAKDRMHCDHAFYAGATHENAAYLAEVEATPGC